MSAIYLLRGDQQVGPFTAEELEGKLAAGELSPEDLFWSEGMEDWQALAAVISVEADPEGGGEEEPAEEDSSLPPAAEEEEEFDILHQIAGTTITTRSIHLECGAVLSLEEITKVAVQTETIRRGKPIAGCVLIGVLVVSIALVLVEFPSFKPTHWILWALVLVGLIFWWIRLLLRVLQVGASMVVIGLKDGDERIVPTTLDTARQLRDAITTSLPEIEPDTEGDEELAEEDSAPSLQAEKIGILQKIVRWIRNKSPTKIEPVPEGGEESVQEDLDPSFVAVPTDIRHEIAGTRITARAIHLKSGGVLSLAEIARVTVQTETIQRDKPIVGCVIIGILIIGLAITKIPHTDDANWIYWVILLLGMIFLWIRFLLQALREGDSMLVIKLKRGDERLIGATPAVARQLCEAIEKCLPSGSSSPRTNTAARNLRSR